MRLTVLYNIFNYVEIEIGGQIIDKQYGEWMALWCELSMIDTTPLQALIGGQGMDTKLCSVPLQFWFCRNIGLALPLVALQYHDVTLEVNFRPLAQMYSFIGSSYGTSIFYNMTSDGTNVVKVYKPYSSALDLTQLDVEAHIIHFPDGTTYFINPTTAVSSGDGSLATPWLLNVTQNVPAIYTNASTYITPNGVIDMSANPQISEIRLYVDYIYLSQDFKENNNMTGLFYEDSLCIKKVYDDGATIYQFKKCSVVE